MLLSNCNSIVDLASQVARELSQVRVGASVEAIHQCGERNSHLAVVIVSDNSIDNRIVWTFNKQTGGFSSGSYGLSDERASIEAMRRVRLYR